MYHFKRFLFEDKHKKRNTTHSLAFISNFKKIPIMPISFTNPIEFDEQRVKTKVIVETSFSK